MKIIPHIEFNKYDFALGLEICSKKSNMVIQEFIDTIVQLQQENQKLKKQLEERQKDILEEILSKYEEIIDK